MLRLKKSLIIFAGLLISVLIFGQYAFAADEMTDSEGMGTQPDETMSAETPSQSEMATQNQMPGPVYVSPEGKIFVKHGTPLYLRLATSPNNANESWIMRNEESENKPGPPTPFELEGQGRHTIRHMADHRVPQKRKGNHLFYVFDDARSPRSSVSVTKAPWVYNGNVNIYGKPVTITFNFKDADSGLFSGYVALNSPTFSPYTNPIKLEEEADYKLQYYALDNVGNKSRVRTRYYALDFTPPETVHNIIGNHVMVGYEDILSPRSRISLKSRDLKAGVKQIRYRFKGKRGIYNNQLLTMSGLTDGTHSMVYAAEDRVKNTEGNHTYTFYLDSVPPVVTDSLVGDKFIKGSTTYVSGRTTVEMSATDNKAGVNRIRYAINSGRKITYADPFNFPKKNGKAQYEYRASDKVRNVSDRVAKTVTVDISPPDITPSFEGEHYFSRNKHYIRKDTLISLKTKDNLSGVKSVSYVLDQGAENFDEKPFKIETEEEHILMYSATDYVNNKTEDKFITLYVDEKIPEIFYHFSVNETVPGKGIYPIKSLLYLAATDKQSGIRNIYYSINGRAEQIYKKPISFREKRPYHVAVRAVDKVGNIVRTDIALEIE